MEANGVIIIVIIVFAIIIIVAFMIFRTHSKAKIKGPFGIDLEVEGENKPPSSIAGISAANITSREGGVTASDGTGRGVDAKKINAKKDVVLTSNPVTPENKINTPVSEPQAASRLNAQSLNAGGNIAIQ
jgi:hypothetical protein